MSKLLKENLWWIFLILIAFCIGFFIGKLTQNLSLLEMDYKIGIADLTNFILAIVVACLIQLSLTPFVSDKRVIKDFLMDEIKSCIDFLAKIKDKIDENSIKATTSQEDKLRINSMISRDLGLKIASINDQLATSYDSKSKNLRAKISASYQEYWKNTTGGELMGNKFKFDIRFSTSHDKDYEKIQICLKRGIHEVNQY